MQIYNSTERYTDLSTNRLSAANTNLGVLVADEVLMKNLTVTGTAFSEQGWQRPSVVYGDSFKLGPEHSSKTIYLRSPAAGTEIKLSTVQECNVADWMCEWEIYFYDVTNDVTFTTATGETISGRWCSNSGTAESVSGSGPSAVTYSAAQHTDGSKLRITHHPGGFSIWAHANQGALL